MPFRGKSQVETMKGGRWTALRRRSPSLESFKTFSTGRWQKIPGIATSMPAIFGLDIRRFLQRPPAWAAARRHPRGMRL